MLPWDWIYLFTFNCASLQSPCISSHLHTQYILLEWSSKMSFPVTLRPFVLRFSKSRMTWNTNQQSCTPQRSWHPRWVYFEVYTESFWWRLFVEANKCGRAIRGALKIMQRHRGMYFIKWKQVNFVTILELQ